ncbi:MAG: phenylalanine--tRNA ligase subunit beta [Candidatus Aminicenantes bacterium]|nr:phenylalanine--tRNA ligase subunit beta [Candidatus Aminicenantes bacterium]
MKISVDWLKEYVDVGISPSELRERLTMIGFVAEAMEERDGDIVLDVETYANRPDTLGHLGMAREVAAMLDLPLKTPAPSLSELEEKTSDAADVQVLDEALCPRYCGLVVRDVNVGPSPDWLRRRIEAMGLNPVNNVVDVSNFILFATAQPVHFFDLEKLAGPTIVVRRARKGELLRSLDGRDLALEPDSLVIADEARPVALAGVIGGEETAVGESTHHVFIESAHFDPVSVRKTAKALGLQTDASYRFERETDVAFPPQAARLAASLLGAFGGRPTSGLVDIYPKPRKSCECRLRQKRVAELLGVEIDAEFIRKLLTALGFGLQAQPRQSWLVKVPSFRVDIEREADLVEEIARFYGYDRIPSVVPPLKIIERAASEENRPDRAAQVLLQQGFDEVLTYSFADTERQKILELPRRPIDIRNPVSSKASQLRTSLAGGLLETMAWNLNRGAEGLQIFEFGHVYFQEEEAHREQTALALAAMGRRGGAHWLARPEETGFFHVKGAVEAVMSRLRFEPFRFQHLEHPIFEEGSGLTLFYKGDLVGRLGRLRRRITEAYGIKDDVHYGELDLDALFGKTSRPFQFSPVPKFPAVVRDLAFLVPESATFQDIKDGIEKMALPNLESFDLVDRFAGASLPAGRVSLAFRFVFRSPGGTLQSAEVDRLQGRIVGHLRTALKMELREGGEIDNRAGKN